MTDWTTDLKGIPTSFAKTHHNMIEKQSIKALEWLKTGSYRGGQVGHQGKLARFVRDTLLSKARWVHGWDLASTYVCVAPTLTFCPCISGRGQTEVQGE